MPVFSPYKGLTELLVPAAGQEIEAIDAYKMASGLADAHYNLSRLYEQLGEIKSALMHLKVYHLMVDPPGNQD